MQQTVLNTSKVPGIRLLYYFSYGVAVASGFVCVLYCYFLLSNYFSPYSPEKLNALMEQQRIWDAEMEKEKGNKAELAIVRQSTPVAETAESAGEGDAAGGDAEEKGDSGQRPNIDLANQGSNMRLVDPPPAPFLMYPSDYTQLLELRALLAKDPGNQEIRTQIRDLDQQLRVEYFRRKAIATQGAPLLLIAAILCAISARIASVLNRPLPTPQSADPKKQRQEELKLGVIGYWGVLLTTMLCAGIAIGLFFYPKNDSETFLLAQHEQEMRDKLSSEPSGSLTPESARSTDSASKGETGAKNGTSQKDETGSTNETGSKVETDTKVETAHNVEADATQQAESNAGQGALTPDREQFWAKLQKNWPGFRGFDGSGITSYTNILTNWDVETGEGILWKSEVPLLGHNSPIVWENKVFLSGADDQTRKVYCFNAENGTLIWETEIPAQSSSSTGLKMGVNIMEDTGYAAPTLVTDGERVYAIFANLDLVALDDEGQLIWGKNLGIPDNHYGYSTSLAVYFDRIIVQYDQGDGRKADQSKLWAFRGNNGEVVWETPRTMMSSWPSPVIRKIGDQFQILTGADPWMIAYDPESGKEIWRCKAYSGGDTAPSPTGWGDVVFSANANPGVLAMNARGTGDISKTDKELWKEIGVRPDTCSPVVYEKYLYSLGPGPYLQCIDTEQGILIWELEVDDEATFYSSPSWVNGLLYLFDKNEEGAKAYVIDPKKAVLDATGTALESGREKEMILSVNKMGEPVFSSPAFSDGKMFIRGTTTLYCIGATGK
ncbi:MAG: PQQ-binding-like beta-propeller repeat protein [Thermoguttaceae bacterium]